MKQYLELEDFNGRALLVDASSIIAITDATERKGNCYIHCSGLQTPLGARISHFDLIKKLIELKLFQLVKF